MAVRGSPPGATIRAVSTNPTAAAGSYRSPTRRSRCSKSATGTRCDCASRATTCRRGSTARRWPTCTMRRSAPPRAASPCRSTTAAASRYSGATSASRHSDHPNPTAKQIESHGNQPQKLSENGGCRHALHHRPAVGAGRPRTHRPERPAHQGHHRRRRHRPQQLPLHQYARMPAGSHLRCGQRPPPERRGAGGRQVRPDAENLPLLPRPDHRPECRYRTHRHPAPLARHHGRRGRQGRQGHLVRKTHDAHHRRGQARRRGSQALRAHLPPQYVVPLCGHLLRTRHDGRTTQETRAERHARMAAEGDHLGGHGLHVEILLGGPRTPRTATRTCGPRLRPVARPGPRETLQRPPYAPDLPRILGLRRRRGSPTWASTTWTRCSTCWARTTRRP